MTDDPAPTTAAERWARWSVMWSQVSPLVEQQPWFQSLDAHRKAYCKEAVTKSALATSHPTMPLDIFVMKNMVTRPGTGDKPGWAAYEASRKSWVERLKVIADAAREAGNV